MHKIAKVVAELRKRRDLLDEAIAVLEGLGNRGERRGPGRPPKLVTLSSRRRAVSSATRRRMAEARRRWWEAKKRAATA